MAAAAACVESPPSEVCGIRLRALPRLRATGCIPMPRRQPLVRVTQSVSRVRDLLVVGRFTSIIIICYH